MRFKPTKGRADQFKTARAVLRQRDTYLLAIHSSFWAKKHKRWGLPGGGIERGEEPHFAVQRELEEELEIYHQEFCEVGPFTYKGAQHMVYGADIHQTIHDFDRSELLQIKWFTLNEIESLASNRQLHAGYELEAILRFNNMSV